MEENKKKQILKYKIVETSSEDSDSPITEVLKGNVSKGWASIRFCNYPQEILIQFHSPVKISQINILSHEKRISSLVEFYTFFPSDYRELLNPNTITAEKNLNNLSFSKLGYIRMDTNQRSNYKAREFRRVYVESECLYLKLLLHKNYVNKYNVFNQVSLMYFEFYGNPVTIKPENFLKGLSDKSILEREKEENELKDLDDISKEKIRILKSHLESAVKNEDFDEAKRLKNNISTVVEYSKKLLQLEKNKKIFVDMQDFDSAKIYKMEIDKLKSKYKTIDKQIKELNYTSNHNNTIDLNRSLGITNIIEESKENKDKSLNFNNIYTNSNPNFVVNKSFALDKDKEK